MANKTLTQLIGGTIKSIQRGIVTIGDSNINDNVTISQVDLNKCFLNFAGSNTSGSSAGGLAKARLTTSTNIFVDKGVSAGLMTLTWEVIEFE